jgi:hypothetical protein
MPGINDFPALGRVMEVPDDQSVVFYPKGTRYRLHLKTASRYDGPTKLPIEASLRVNARKVYSVPSGGNFITPIFGPPKIIQGRVKFLTDRQMIVHAGTHVLVTLPSSDPAIDLNNGAIAVGSMVNVVALPGATFELLQETVPPAVAQAAADDSD